MTLSYKQAPISFPYTTKNQGHIAHSDNKNIYSIKSWYTIYVTLLASAIWQVKFAKCQMTWQKHFYLKHFAFLGDIWKWAITFYFLCTLFAILFFFVFVCFKPSYHNCLKMITFLLATFSSNFFSAWFAFYQVFPLSKRNRQSGLTAFHVTNCAKYWTRLNRLIKF